MLINKTLVLAGRQFQPNLIGEHWLIRNEILPEGAFIGNRISTDMVAGFSTAFLDLVVLPERITISGKPETLDGDFVALAHKLIERLPDPGYVAVGLNSKWDISSFGDTVPLTQKFKPSCELPPQLSGASGKWGSVVTIDSIRGSLLRVQILPVEKVGTPNTTAILADFNFHFDSEQADDPKSATLAAIGYWDETIRIANQIAAHFVGELPA